MHDPKKKNEKLITFTGKESCLYTLTVEYLKFLGNGHGGSLQPRCKAGFPNQPDPTKNICYSLALSDLRNVRIWRVFIFPSLKNVISGD